jgi:uncharacterized oligopeptide transporter (OPT) family protein
VTYLYFYKVSVTNILILISYILFQSAFIVTSYAPYPDGPASIADVSAADTPDGNDKSPKQEQENIDYEG